MEENLIRAVCEYVKSNNEQPKKELAGCSEVEVAKCFETLMNENIIVMQTVKYSVTVSGDKSYFKLMVAENRLKEKYGIAL